MMISNEETHNHKQLLTHLIEISSKVGGIEQSRQTQDERINELNNFVSSQMKREEEIQKTLIRTMEKLEDRMNTIPNDVHKKHHEAMDVFLKAQAAKQEFWAEVRRKLAQNGIWATFVGIAAVIWYAFVTFIRNGGN